MSKPSFKKNSVLVCRLFNAKSIFNTNNQFYFKQFSLAEYIVELLKTFLFLAIQFSQTVQIHTIQFSLSIFPMSKTVLFQKTQFCISTQFSTI